MAKTKTGGSTAKQKAFRIKLVIFVLVLVAYGASVYFFRTDIDRMLNIAKYGTADVANLKKQDGSAATAGDLSAGSLKVHYVDVGQGDACVIELPDGKNMLIDGGKDNQKEKFFTYMESSLPDIKNFDYAILTHSDDDHCGGFDDIIKRFPVKSGGRIYRPDQVATNKGYIDPALSKTGLQGLWDNVAANQKWNKDTVSYKNAIAAMYAGEAEVYVTDATKNAEPFKASGGNNITKLDDGTTMYKNSKMDILGDVNGDGKYDGANSDYLVTFYAPTKGGWNNVNDYSPIISLDYQGKRFMFTGDSEAEGEARFAAEYTRDSFGKKADVIKLGHHGSSTSTSEGYLDVVMPLAKKDVTAANKNDGVLAVVSSNQEGNNYKHPHTETLARLTDNYGVKADNIIRTDKVGTILLSVNNKQLMYGTVKIEQTETIEPLSWITIGGGIVVIIFILLFCIKAGRTGKAGVKRNAAVNALNAAGTDVRSSAPADSFRIAPQYEPGAKQTTGKKTTGASASRSSPSTSKNNTSAKNTSISAKKKTSAASDKDKIDKAVNDIKKKLNKF